MILMDTVNHEFPPILNCWYLTGATASGKSKVSRKLAKTLDAEIVSMDSMAVYQDMNIGTAKPTATDMDEVPHHLINMVAPSCDYSLADYLSAAHQTAEKIRQAGKQVLFVGGTPLYLKALLRGASGGPPADPDFRRQVEEEIERVGMDALRERLEQVDPLSAAKLHPNDKRRMIRALEVHKLTGFPISHHQMQFEDQNQARCERVFALSWERSALHDRINKRTAGMFDEGLVEEVSQILKDHENFSQTALQGVGYAESVKHLQGEFTLEQAIDQTKIRTRRFARRQETWFRGLEECRWVTVNDDLSDKDILASIKMAANQPLQPK